MTIPDRSRLDALWEAMQSIPAAGRQQRASQAQPSRTPVWPMPGGGPRPSSAAAPTQTRTAARGAHSPSTTPPPAASGEAVPEQVSTVKITSNSHFDVAHQVSIDPYGKNPLEQDARQNLRGVRMRGTAPKMFMGGSEDLPPFTASGLDPRLLLKLPYQVRHYAAAEASLAAVHGLFEQYADMPHARLDHQGLGEAIGRVSHWLFNQGSEEA